MPDRLQATRAGGQARARLLPEASTDTISAAFHSCCLWHASAMARRSWRKQLNLVAAGQETTVLVFYNQTSILVTQAQARAQGKARLKERS